MKKLNHISIKFSVVVVLFAMMTTACKKDWLDRKPLGQLTEEDLDPGSLEGQVFAIYGGGLRHEGISGLPYIAVHNMRADDADKGSAPGDGEDAARIFDNFQYVTDFWLINSYWTGQYNLINLSNNVLAAADSLENQTPLTQTNIGEAKFFRAFAYFNLVRSFGEVPKIDFRINDPSEAIVPKSTIAEIYQLIDSDLQEAVASLPPTWDSQYEGRITRGAALALQAKTFLTRQMWSQALASAEMVISSEVYDLSTPYNQIFRESEENGKESVFEIQAHYTQSNTEVGITYASRQGVRGAGDWNLGWGWNVPNQKMADAFEEGDPRKDETLLYTGQMNSPYGETLPSNLPRPYWNKKVYTDPDIRRSTGSLGGAWFNMRVIRYADVVLMAAEAANELGGATNTEKALEYLEMIRARARGGNSAVLPEVTTTNQGELRNAIRHERQVELGMEHQRFFDLVRWGTAAANLPGYQHRNRFLPIPQPEIDKSGGVLEQNPDY
ncbi:RagB/SusD family nutrient uptake outer membrane protein [Albibacterium indicum]|uniref:RagB/SusD family nutrient uptake outer membrane protein n=1 Tax=Albibacterium indicum TaxID=2292082 RepID=UPI000E53C703|nr:RagB/SusD family nutrient uptake outer membrane protein [Pedobacter indicus]